MVALPNAVAVCLRRAPSCRAYTSNAAVQHDYLRSSMMAVWFEADTKEGSFSMLHAVKRDLSKYLTANWS